MPIGLSFKELTAITITIFTDKILSTLFNIYIYIYIYRERERERDRDILSMSIYIKSLDVAYVASKAHNANFT